MFNIQSAIVMLTDGSDIVFLKTDLPCPFVPESGLTQPVELEFKCSYETGVEYVKKNFGVAPKIINLR